MEPLSVIVSSPPVPAAADVAPSDAVSAKRPPVTGLLRDCRAYRVDGPEGRFGVVRRVVLEGDGGRPPHLVVTMGLFIIRTVRIPIADIVEIRPDLRRVVVRTAVEAPLRSRLELHGIVRRLLRSVR